MTDPLLRMLANLPQADSDPVRAARVRARCRGALTAAPRGGPQRRGPRRTRTLLAALAAVYSLEVARQALLLLGVV